MPEGDTVHAAARRLHAALAGEVLVRTDFRVPRFATAQLAGRVVEEVVARGKHLLFRIGGGVTFHAHFALDGAFHLYRPGARWRAPAWRVRAVLETPAWQAVGVDLAITELVRTADEARLLAHLGPDPLGPDWDAAEALRRLVADPARPLAEALRDQRVMAGPGNVWTCELCFLRGADPWTPVGLVRDPARLVALVHEVFASSRTVAGHVTTGDARAGHRHWVYGRGGRPCRRCGTPIAVRDRQAAERVTFWCPHCQPAPRPRAAGPGGA